ncbi:hypothetical protein TWF569_008907 [Orbilia oligospora]|nr:hypothetical protein TWF706_010608 [Orbilia oligospora]KAF3143122.1 hypothetical protein TWF594_005191 [Orbilia oligospora]KAF3155539.1 hypothetical protein TWF569_008907 [Orbilia oligospora]
MATAVMIDNGLSLGWETSQCQSYKYFLKIVTVEQPKFPTPRERGKNIERLFYPKSDLQTIFMQDGVLRDIVCCTTCKGCRLFRGPETTAGNKLEESLIINSIIDPERPRFILLAILVCMGQAYLIRYLNPERFSDNNLDNITNEMVMRRGHLEELLPQTLSVEHFLDRFQMLRRRFDLKTFDQFVKGRRLEFDEEDILPFSVDEEHSSSTYGIVHKFEIYPCYNNITRNGMKVTKFARKILRAEIAETDFRYERDNLAFVNSLNNPNIIEMFCWYTRKKPGYKKEFTYVFPFMEASLHDVLSGKPNTPADLKNHQTTSLYSSPMWQQMVDVTSGLVAIHNPDPNLLKKQGLQPAPGGWLGYHFDFKPSNILVDSDGKFLITDFGLSVFKRRGTDDTATSTRGEESEMLYDPLGTPAYQPPGVQPAPGILPIGDVPYDIPRMRRTYDVWSLACVMTEVVTYILGYDGEKGAAAVTRFKEMRMADSTRDSSSAWHCRSSAANNEPRLKPSVEDWFKYMKILAGTEDPYLSTILDLLEEMFGIYSRSNSKDAEQRLRAANQREKERQELIFRGSTIPTEEVQFSVTQWIKARGNENLIYDSELQAKYITFVQDYHHDRSSIDSRGDRLKLRPWVEVQALKVFQSEHTKSRLRVVITFKEQNRLVAESEGSVYSTEQFIPLYHYEDLNEDFANSCAFRNAFVDRLIGFEDFSDLRQFQEAILGYRIKSESDQNIRFCFTDKEDSKWKSEIDGARVEIWTTHGLSKPPQLYNGGQKGIGLPMLNRINSGQGSTLTPPHTPREGSIITQASPISGKSHDSSVIIFRPSHRDILVIPALQHKARICGGCPGNWSDPNSISFIVNPPHDKFAVLRFRSESLGPRLDPLDPISCIPGMPLGLKEAVLRSRDDVDKKTVFNQTCVSLRFKSEKHCLDFIAAFSRAFPWKHLYETGFFNAHFGANRNPALAVPI